MKILEGCIDEQLLRYEGLRRLVTTLFSHTKATPLA